MKHLALSSPTVDAESGQTRLHERRRFGGDSDFAAEEIFTFLEARDICYAIRIPADRSLKATAGQRLRVLGGIRPWPLRCRYACFDHRATGWSRQRRVIAKLEQDPDRARLRVGFIVTNHSGAPEEVERFLIEATRQCAAASEPTLRLSATMAAPWGLPGLCEPSPARP